MKTTLELNDDLFRRAKTLAAQEGITLRQLVERAIDREVRGITGENFELDDRSFTGHGPQPGIDESNWSALQEIIYQGRGS
ncbi:MAG: hypothetical protein ACLGHX_10235 [Acidimicrobiia bacterium]